MNKRLLLLSILILPPLLFSNQVFSEEGFEIVYGVTTREDMKENFGEPSVIWNTKEGSEVRSYCNVMAEVLEDKTKFRNKIVFMITFTESGLVVDAKVSSSISG